jgi:NAD(P)-dependent dehydrogenase (short-subunit alcohol dehydrogenase family)
MTDPDGVIPYPGHTSDMEDRPRDEMRDYTGRDLLAGKRALITGGDSGIGRAAAVAFAKEGADVAIAYLEENDDAAHTASLVEDYSSTKGAVLALTYSLAQSLSERRIRVNCVAPGPVWTPLIPATMDADRVDSFGGHTPFGRAAQPDEIAPSYVFFAAAQLSSYYSGEVLAPIGGETLPG